MIPAAGGDEVLYRCRIGHGGLARITLARIQQIATHKHLATV
jgi:hypothetical protein